jgi:hypothetical protein
MVIGMAERLKKIIPLVAVGAAVYFLSRGVPTAAAPTPTPTPTVDRVGGSYTITLEPVNDIYLRYAGAWLDVDQGPNFYEKGQANLGTIVATLTKKIISIPTSPGPHTLYVRVSAPDFQWRVCVQVDSVNLGCKTTSAGLATFSFTA